MQGQGKVVVVTGCTTGGIGHGLAVEFYNQGCTVYATARRPEAVDPPEVSGSSSDTRWRCLALDVTSEESIRTAVDTVIKDQGHIDVLVNNAGIGAYGPIAEVPLKTAKKVYDINVFGTIAMCQAVIPSMVAAKSGTIVNVGSAVGLVATPWAGIYTSSKAAIHSFSDSMRMELYPFGVNVMTLAPGAVKSNLGKNNVAALELGNLKIYKPWEASIQERAVASQTAKGATPSNEFAKMVVPKVLSPRPPFFYLAGCFSAMFKVLDFLPQWVSHWLFMKSFGVLKPASAGEKPKDE